MEKSKGFVIKNWEWILPPLFLFIFYFGFILGMSYIWEDLLYVFYPGANYFAVSIAQGQFPFWMSGVRCGMPFYSDIQMGVFYPLKWLLVPFAGSGQLPFQIYQIYVVLQLALGAFFMTLFLKRLKMANIPAVIGGTVFVLSQFMTLHIIHMAFIEIMIWIPLALYFVKLIFDTKQIRYFFFLTLTLLMTFLPGSPQITLYAAFLIVGYWLFNYVMEAAEKKPKLLPAVAKGLLEALKIGGLYIAVIILGAMMFLPSIENWSLSGRQKYTFETLADQSLPPYCVMNFFAANYFGEIDPKHKEVPYWGFNKDTQEYQRWKAGSWQYWEFGFYAGQIALIALVFILFSLKKWKDRKEMFFFLIVAALALWFSLGRYGGLYNLLFYIVPGVGMFRTPARMVGILDLALAVLSAVFVQKAIFETEIRKLEWKKPALTLGFAFAVLIFGTLLFGRAIFPEMQTSAFFSYSLMQLVLGASFCALTIGLLVAANSAKSERTKTILTVVTATVVFFDLFLGSSRFHQGKDKPSEYFSDRDNLITQMSGLKKQIGDFRFGQMNNNALAEEMVFPRNIAYVQKDIEVPEGYILFGLKNFSDFTTMKNEWAKIDIENIRVIAASISNKLQLILYTNSLPRVKFYPEVMRFDSQEAVIKAIDNRMLDYRKYAGVVFSDWTNNEPVSTNAIPESTVSYKRINNETMKIRYNAPRSGILFVSQTLYPGWKAFDATGKPMKVVPVFGTFAGIVVPQAGEGEIEFRFEPDSFRLGATVSAIAAILFVIGLVLSMIGKKKQG